MQTKKRLPVVATRTSARVPRDGVPITAKAIARAQKRDESLQRYVGFQFNYFKFCT